VSQEGYFRDKESTLGWVQEGDVGFELDKGVQRYCLCSWGNDGRQGCCPQAKQKSRSFRISSMNH
jgi:hypothetical protein